jgi:hypothetical protein
MAYSSALQLARQAGGVFEGLFSPRPQHSTVAFERGGKFSMNGGDPSMSKPDRTTPEFQLDPNEIQLPHALRSDDRDAVLAQLRREILESNLLPKLVRRTRGQYLKRFAIPDLCFRMACQIKRERRAQRPEPDRMARARIWRQVAEQSAPGKSQIPDATDDEVRTWLPAPPPAPPKSRTVICASCGEAFRVRYDSDLVICGKCRAKMRIAQATGLEEKHCEYCGLLFQPTDSRQVYHPKCQKKAENRRRIERGKGGSAPISPA